MAVIGDEDATARSRHSQAMEQRKHERRRFTQMEPLKKRLADEITRLRKEARGTPPGIERERLIRKARQAETASHMQEWLMSRGLQSQK
jgi:hypothetical protein